MSNGSMTLDTDGHVEYLCDDTYDFETISGAIFIVIFLFSVTGNTLLLCVLVFYEDLKNVTNLFILNLACSDLVFTVTLPFWAVYQIHHWIFGEVACKLLTAAYFVGVYSSTILLTAMTVDRFIMVVLYNWPNNPAKRQMCAIATCAAAWLISIAASVSDAIKVKVESQWDDYFACEAPSDGSDVNLGYYLQISLLFLVPIAIIVFCYSAILKTALQTSNRKRYRTIMVVFCIVTAFFISWGPYNTVIFIQTLYEPVGCYAKERLYVAYSVCRILAFSHCCMNPLLYMLSEKFRKHLLLLLRCKHFKKNNEKGMGQYNCGNQNVAFIAQNSAVLLEEPAK